MWRKDGDGEVFTYMTHDQMPSWTEWCQELADVDLYRRVHCTGYAAIQIGTKSFRFRHEKWHKVRMTVHLNSQRGQPGYISLWLDDHAEVHATDVVMRSRFDFGIDGILFSTFYGGSDPTWACPADTYTYFRNMKLSTNVELPRIDELLG